MKKPMLTGLLAICLCALPLGAMASAQQTGGNTAAPGDQPNQTGSYYHNQAEQAARDTESRVGNGGGNWGWFGLLGLVGLAGLGGRRHADEAMPRQAFRRDEPLGSR